MARLQDLLAPGRGSLVARSAGRPAAAALPIAGRQTAGRPRRRQRRQRRRHHRRASPAAARGRPSGAGADGTTPSPVELPPRRRRRSLQAPFGRRGPVSFGGDQAGAIPSTMATPSGCSATPSWGGAPGGFPVGAGFVHNSMRCSTTVHASSTSSGRMGGTGTRPSPTVPEHCWPSPDRSIHRVLLVSAALHTSSPMAQGWGDPGMDVSATDGRRCGSAPTTIPCARRRRRPFHELTVDHDTLLHGCEGVPALCWPERTSPCGPHGLRQSGGCPRTIRSTSAQPTLTPSA
jgi:hypothetical protein